MPAFDRPDPHEYAKYYGAYVEAVPPGDVLALLAAQLDQTLAMLDGIPAQRWGYRYAPGKWSVREVVGHLADAERVFAYRALRFARRDGTPLPGFEQDDYVLHGGFEARALPDVAREFAAVRRASLALFHGLDDDAVGRRGTANGVEFTVRAIPWIIAGHERHHVAVLRARYL